MKQRSRRTIRTASALRVRLAIALVVTALQTVSNASGSEAPVSVAGYRKWVRVNPKPHRVTSNLAFLCRGLTPQEKSKLASDPHADKFVTVYVSPAARQAMLYQKQPRFPRNSLIIKEKLSKSDSKSPELLTVMHKREKGYNPSAGDWEYLVLDGSGRKIQAQGRLANCQSCHATWKETDYVSRAYFTEAMKRRLIASAGRRH